MKIFIVQGAIIDFSGPFLGVASGIPTALNIDVIVPVLERLLQRALPLDRRVLHHRAAFGSAEAAT